MKSFKVLLVGAALCMAPSVFAQISLPAVIGSHMVLQQQSEAPVWGWASPGESVTVATSWDGGKVSATAGPDGKWMVKVPTPVAGGPYTIDITGKNSLHLEDVLIGEVWLCSGQSNMEMPLRGWPEYGGPIEGSDEAIQQANYPQIRLFTVNRATSFAPVDTCSGTWAACTPETARDFSATGYFFGLNLYKQLNVPVGLIHSSWGGTPAEAWTGSDFISKIPKFATSPGRCDPEKFYTDAVDAYNRQMKAWVDSIGFGVSDPGPEWTVKPDGSSDWVDVQVPAEWGKTPLGSYAGIVDYQLVFSVPKKFASRESVLELGPIDEMDVTWINGKLVGSHLNPAEWAVPRSYDVPAGTLKPGQNILSVKVGNTLGLGGIDGKDAVIAIHLKGKKSGAVTLAGTWKARKAGTFGKIPSMPDCVNCNYACTPTMLYNAMIHPLVPFDIKGAIWYQGESNRYDGMLYRKIFQGMIENWRHDWNEGDFPFYFVQIAPYTYRDDYSTGLLREAQDYVRKTVPNTGMAVTMDIGDLRNIHPGKKAAVGKRLANIALAKTYGFLNTAWAGPFYRGMQKEGRKIRILLDEASGGLTSFGQEITGFQIAAADGVFKPAKAEISNGSILVSSDEVTLPVAVRYGWESTDVGNLFNLLGLPLAPFRTDSWDTIK